MICSVRGSSFTALLQLFYLLSELALGVRHHLRGDGAIALGIDDVLQMNALNPDITTQTGDVLPEQRAINAHWSLWIGSYHMRTKREHKPLGFVLWMFTGTKNVEIFQFVNSVTVRSQPTATTCPIFDNSLKDSIGWLLWQNQKPRLWTCRCLRAPRWPLPVN